MLWKYVLNPLGHALAYLISILNQTLLLATYASSASLSLLGLLSFVVHFCCRLPRIFFTFLLAIVVLGRGGQRSADV